MECDQVVLLHVLKTENGLDVAQYMCKHNDDNVFLNL